MYTLVSDYVNLIGRPHSIFQFPLMDMIVDPAHRENFNFLPFSQLILSLDTPITHPGVHNMTRNKMRVAIESGKGMKVKVVKLC